MVSCRRCPQSLLFLPSCCRSERGRKQEAGVVARRGREADPVKKSSGFCFFFFFFSFRGGQRGERERERRPKASSPLSSLRLCFVSGIDLFSCGTRGGEWERGELLRRLGVARGRENEKEGTKKEKKKTRFGFAAEHSSWIELKEKPKNERLCLFCFRGDLFPTFSRSSLALFPVAGSSLERDLPQGPLGTAKQGLVPRTLETRLESRG